MVKNRHLTLTFSQAKHFSCTHLKFWEHEEQLSGFIVLKFRADRNKTMVGKHDMMGSIF